MCSFRLSGGPFWSCHRLFWSYRKFKGHFGLGRFGSWAVLVVSLTLHEKPMLITDVLIDCLSCYHAGFVISNYEIIHYRNNNQC